MIDPRTSWARSTVRLLHTLPARSATVLTMMYFWRLSQAEICAETGWSERSVRQACATGLRDLGRLLEAEASTPAP